jgi:hypothetical protein
MYFKRQKTKRLLNIGQYYANLLNVNAAGDHVYELTYDISVGDAFKHNGLQVVVSVYSRILPKVTLVTSATDSGKTSSAAVVDFAREQMNRVKSQKREQNKLLITSVNSDITAHIDNSLVQSLKNGSYVAPKKQKTTILSQTEFQNKNEDVLSFTLRKDGSFSDVDVNRRRLNFELLAKASDPSKIVDLSHVSIPAIDSLRGTITKSRITLSKETPDVLLQTSYLTGSLTETRQYVTKIETDDDRVSIPVTVTLPADKLRGLNLVHVRFELKNTQTSEVLESIDKQLAFSEHLRLYYTPRKPPVVGLTSTYRGTANIEIKQVDPQGSYVKIFRKQIGRSTTVYPDYSLLQTLELSPGKSAFVNIEAPEGILNIFRFISVGKLGTYGSDYRNLILKTDNTRQRNQIMLSLLPDDTGVQVVLSDYGTNIVSLQIQVRDLTIFESTYRNVGQPINVSSGDEEQSIVSYTDQSVYDGHTYEYVVKLINRNGIIENSPPTVVNYVKTQPGKIVTTIEDVVVTSGDKPDVTFKLRSEVIDQNVQLIKNVLDRADLLKYFEGDVSRERAFLNDLLTHSITRTNLKTGQKEDFGIITGDTFIDSAYRDKNSVMPLQLGQKYRYEICALLRSPETLFETLQKQDVDPVTKKKYTFKPSKFLHPMTLRRGVLSSTQGLKLRFGLDELLYGNFGLTKTLDVSFDDQRARPVSLTAARFDRDLVTLNWSIAGAVDQIDHFLIFKEIEGVRTLLSKVHSDFVDDSCAFLHDLQVRDIGEIKYLIMPVYNDYSVGTYVVSNSVVVESV